MSTALLALVLFTFTTYVTAFFQIRAHPHYYDGIVLGRSTNFTIRCEQACNTYKASSLSLRLRDDGSDIPITLLPESDCKSAAGYTVMTQRMLTKSFFTNSPLPTPFECSFIGKVQIPDSSLPLVNLSAGYMDVQVGTLSASVQLLSPIPLYQPSMSTSFLAVYFPENQPATAAFTSYLPLRIDDNVLITSPNLSRRISQPTACVSATAGEALRLSIDGDTLIMRTVRNQPLRNSIEPFSCNFTFIPMFHDMQPEPFALMAPSHLITTSTLPFLTYSSAFAKVAPRYLPKQNEKSVVRVTLPLNNVNTGEKITLLTRKTPFSLSACRIAESPSSAVAATVQYKGYSQYLDVDEVDMTFISTPPTLDSGGIYCYLDLEPLPSHYIPSLRIFGFHTDTKLIILAPPVNNQLQSYTWNSSYRSEVVIRHAGSSWVQMSFDFHISRVDFDIAREYLKASGSGPPEMFEFVLDQINPDLSSLEDIITCSHDNIFQMNLSKEGILTFIVTPDVEMFPFDTEISLTLTLRDVASLVLRNPENTYTYAMAEIPSSSITFDCAVDGATHNTPMEDGIVPFRLDIADLKYGDKMYDHLTLNFYNQDIAWGNIFSISCLADQDVVISPEYNPSIRKLASNNGFSIYLYAFSSGYCTGFISYSAEKAGVLTLEAVFSDKYGAAPGSVKLDLQPVPFLPSAPIDVLSISAVETRVHTGRVTQLSWKHAAVAPGASVVLTFNIPMNFTELSRSFSCSDNGQVSFRCNVPTSETITTTFTCDKVLNAPSNECVFSVFFVETESQSLHVHFQPTKTSALAPYQASSPLNGDAATPIAVASAAAPLATVPSFFYLLFPALSILSSSVLTLTSGDAVYKPHVIVTHATVFSSPGFISDSATANISSPIVGTIYLPRDLEPGDVITLLDVSGQQQAPLVFVNLTLNDLVFSTTGSSTTFTDENGCFGVNITILSQLNGTASTPSVFFFMDSLDASPFSISIKSAFNGMFAESRQDISLTAPALSILTLPYGLDAPANNMRVKFHVDMSASESLSLVVGALSVITVNGTCTCQSLGIIDRAFSLDMANNNVITGVSIARDAVCDITFDSFFSGFSTTFELRIRDSTSVLHTSMRFGVLSRWSPTLTTSEPNLYFGDESTLTLSFPQFTTAKAVNRTLILEFPAQMTYNSANCTVNVSSMMKTIPGIINTTLVTFDFTGISMSLDDMDTMICSVSGIPTEEMYYPATVPVHIFGNELISVSLPIFPPILTITPQALFSMAYDTILGVESYVSFTVVDTPVQINDTFSVSVIDPNLDSLDCGADADWDNINRKLIFRKTFPKSRISSSVTCRFLPTEPTFNIASLNTFTSISTNTTIETVTPLVYLQSRFATITFALTPGGELGAVVATNDVYPITLSIAHLDYISAVSSPDDSCFIERSSYTRTTLSLAFTPLLREAGQNSCNLLFTFTKPYFATTATEKLVAVLSYSSVHATSEQEKERFIAKFPDVPVAAGYLRAYAGNFGEIFLQMQKKLTSTMYFPNVWNITEDIPIFKTPVDGNIYDDDNLQVGVAYNVGDRFRLQFTTFTQFGGSTTWQLSDLVYFIPTRQDIDRIPFVEKMITVSLADYPNPVYIPYRSPQKWAIRAMSSSVILSPQSEYVVDLALDHSANEVNVTATTPEGLTLNKCRYLGANTVLNDLDVIVTEPLNVRIPLNFTVMSKFGNFSQRYNIPALFPSLPDNLLYLTCSFQVSESLATHVDTLNITILDAISSYTHARQSITLQMAPPNPSKTILMPFTFTTTTLFNSTEIEKLLNLVTDGLYESVPSLAGAPVHIIEQKIINETISTLSSHNVAFALNPQQLGRMGEKEGSSVAALALTSAPTATAQVQTQLQVQIILGVDVTGQPLLSLQSIHDIMHVFVTRFLTQGYSAAAGEPQYAYEKPSCQDTIACGTGCAACDVGGVCVDNLDCATSTCIEGVCAEPVQVTTTTEEEPKTTNGGVQAVAPALYMPVCILILFFMVS